MRVWWILLLIACIFQAPSSLAAQTSYSMPLADPLLASDAIQKVDSGRSVTFIVRDSTVAYAVRALGYQVGRRVSFNESEPLFAKRVSVHVKMVSVMDAFNAILKGTGLTAMLATDGETIIIRAFAATAETARSTESGSVTGRVTDSASGRGLRGAAVTVQGTKFAVSTDENGAFTIRGIPVGTRILAVKLLGYRSKTTNVVIKEGETAGATIALPQASTTLSEVVTTATGLQRKMEVGNDITTINVDSVMRVMPVSTFTDLLATRVPGLTVMATSGAPGAPSRIRIRGVNSINMSNDPVVIVDGIRINSAQIENSNSLAGSSNLGTDQLVSSPLDAIDPNSIETIEVFKGPSAVALYGTDAVNGVIIVTTKRGQAGPARWSANGIWGQTTMPGKWPTNYVRLGTNQYGTVTECSIVREASTKNGCTGIEGALLQYQLLNDPSTTVFGTGRTQTYRTTVSGGTRGFSYSLSGSFNTELGILKMPDADVGVLQNAGAVVPGWQRRPQGSESQSGTVKVNADLGQADAEFTTTLTRTSSRTTPLQRAIAVASSMPPGSVDLTAFGFSTDPWSALGSGVLRDIPNFRAKTSTQNMTSRNSLRVLANPFRWIQTEATAGVDVSDRKDMGTIGRGDCSTAFGGSCRVLEKGGEYNTGALSGMVTSLIFRASAPTLSFARGLSLRPAIAGDYTRTGQSSIQRTARGLPAGATSGNGAESQYMTENSDYRSTAGVYGEVMFGVADRLYLPLSLRLDAGSGLGAKVRPTYPRINPSFLVSEIPAFRQIPLIGRLETVRLRTAYGQSGVQPSVGAKLRTYTQNARIVDGVSVMSTQINSIGNLLLQPERTSEIEGGVDIETLRGRLNLSLTGYRKRTLDALINITVPLSVNGGGTQLRNVGTVRNTGMEVTMNATVVEQRALVWQVNVGLSKNRNTLVKLGRDSLITNGILNGRLNGISTRFVEGYPLYGQWAFPVTGYADVNGDGWITNGVFDGGIDEVQVGSTPVYLGAPYPVFESSLHSTFTVLRDISIGATFNYQHKLTQTNGSSTIRNGGLGELLNQRPFNDPTTPLVTQAYFAVAQPCINGLGAGTSCGNSIGLVQTTSTLRINGLSIGYILPQRLTSVISRGRTIRVAIQGTNLGLWTNYSGKDPNVNSSMSEVITDTGILPRPRAWQFTIGVN